MKLQCMWLPASVWALILVFVLTQASVKTKKDPSVSAVGFHSASGVCFSFLDERSALCVRDREKKSGKSVSGGVFACVYLCVFLAGCVLGFHHTRTLPPGALARSFSLALLL